MAIDRPTISIVTPSLNQGQFLEETMCSILRQEYPRVEYVVMDGGSSDGSADIIRRYADQLTYWESRPDQGFYDAINRGFAHTSGEIMGWLNSDDKYMPWAFSVVADIFATFPEVEWITSVYPASWNERGQAVAVDFTGGFSGRSFFKGGNFPGEGSYGRRWIQQESTFWRRSLWERAGGRLDTKYHVAADFELWARFFQHAELHGVGALLGGFRAHGSQLSVHRRAQYMNESESVLRSYGQGPCNGLERACRGLFWKVFRQYSLGQLPLWIRKGLFASGLLYPTKVAVWTGKEWEIITGFSV
jgi:glycosyltransferase involved in cell wall biosynthesis